MHDQNRNILIGGTVETNVWLFPRLSRYLKSFLLAKNWGSRITYIDVSYTIPGGGVSYNLQLT